VTDATEAIQKCCPRIQGAGNVFQNQIGQLELKGTLAWDFFYFMDSK
jgi:hypothetical protein